MEEIRIRSMNWKDMDAILRIDTKVTGKSRESFWRNKLYIYTGLDPQACLVAEIEDKVVGFIFGDVRGWEFGVPESGWIEILGVDPKYQRRGIGKMLGEALLKHFKECGVEKAYTLTNREDKRLISYFESLGFGQGDMLNLEKSI